MELLTAHPIPPRTKPETITAPQVRSILRALANAGIPCEAWTSGGELHFTGATAAEVIAAAAGIPSIKINWLKVVRVRHVRSSDRAFSSPLLTWAGEDNADR